MNKINLFSFVINQFGKEKSSDNSSFLIIFCLNHSLLFFMLFFIFFNCIILSCVCWILG